jgi:hypothetical protein
MLEQVAPLREGERTGAAEGDARKNVDPVAVAARTVCGRSIREFSRRQWTTAIAPT